LEVHRSQPTHLKESKLFSRSGPKTGIRALLIHQAFCGPGDPGGTRHYEFARRIVADGSSFIVVTSSISYLTGKPSSQKRSSEMLDGIEILRAKNYESRNSGFVKRLLAMSSFATSSFAKALRAGRADVIIGTTPPIFQAASACLLARIRRRPFILEVRDLWPAFAIDMGILKNAFLIKLSKWLEHTLYRRAVHIVVNSPAYRDYLISEGVPEGRVTVIANGVDGGMFDPDGSGEPIRKRFNLDSKFVVTYAGAMGMANDIDTILMAAATLRSRAPNVHILLVGDGKERPRLQEKASAMQLNNVTFAGTQPKEHMSEVLAASDACVAILQNIRMFRTTYPNKVFDYMAAGRPTVLAIDGVIRDVVEEADGGLFVSPGDPSQLAEAIYKLSRDPDRCRQMGINARAYVIKHFSRADQAQAFSNLVTGIAQHQSVTVNPTV
jgi:glycosyltransferase involved in cell wall biosynthesis